MTPASSILSKGYQPIAFNRLWIAEQGAVGRPDPLDDADSAQNKLPAAFWVS
jgi:hypothetical protein